MLPPATLEGDRLCATPSIQLRALRLPQETGKAGSELRAGQLQGQSAQPLSWFTGQRLGRGWHVEPTRVVGPVATCLVPEASIWVSQSQVCAACWTLQWTGFTDLTFDSHPSDDSVSPGQGGGKGESARKVTSCRDGIQAQTRMQRRGVASGGDSCQQRELHEWETNILLGSQPMKAPEPSLYEELPSGPTRL